MRPRFLADFWGRNLAEAEPSPCLPPAPRSRCLWKIDPAPVLRSLATQIHSYFFPFFLSNNKLCSAVNFSGAVGLITNDQSRTVTVLKVTVTQSSFIPSFIHLPLKLGVYSHSVLCTGNKTEFTVAPLLDITGNRVLLCSQPLELEAEELWKG